MRRPLGDELHGSVERQVAVAASSGEDQSPGGCIQADLDRVLVGLANAWPSGYRLPAGDDPGLKLEIDR